MDLEKSSRRREPVRDSYGRLITYSSRGRLDIEDVWPGTAFFYHIGLPQYCSAVAVSSWKIQFAAAFFYQNGDGTPTASILELLQGPHTLS